MLQRCIAVYGDALHSTPCSLRACTAHCKLLTAAHPSQARHIQSSALLYHTRSWRLLLPSSHTLNHILSHTIDKVTPRGPVAAGSRLQGADCGVAPSSSALHSVAFFDLAGN